MGVNSEPQSSDCEGDISAAWAARHPGSFAPQRALAELTPEEQAAVDRFHDLYYSKLDEGRGLHTVVLSWMGYEMFKCPLDLWTYQEIIFENKPDVIIETGTYKGGSALYLATICDQVGAGLVISIDIDDAHEDIRPKHPRIRYLKGSSTDPSIVTAVKDLIGSRSNIMVILDSDHRRDHVLSELQTFSPLVPVGGYLIVEDTNVNGHPTYPEFGPGPMEAVTEFLATNAEFSADRTRERFLLTMNPSGFLVRLFAAPEAAR